MNSFNLALTRAFERPALLFSGGKDSLVMLKCAEKAFGAGRIPYPLLMIDTGLMALMVNAVQVLALASIVPLLADLRPERIGVGAAGASRSSGTLNASIVVAGAN